MSLKQRKKLYSELAGIAIKGSELAGIAIKGIDLLPNEVEMKSTQRKRLYSRAIQAVGEAYRLALAEGDTDGAVALSQGIQAVMVAASEAFSARGEIALAMAEKLQDLESEGSEKLH